MSALLAFSAPRKADAQADVSFDYFYDALLPYGEWIEVEGYGFCWRSTEMDRQWVPYTDGYWAFTDAGWTWVGYEEFAGIVYHYGRWVSVRGQGWCWVPDYEWGPGWVSWRRGKDYVGWAPLPPQAKWRPEVGISTWVDTRYDIGPGFYNFCRMSDFGAPVLRPVIVDRSRNVTIISNTVNITNITYNHYGTVPVVYNGGLSYSAMRQLSTRPIPALQLVRQSHFDRPDFHGGPGRFSPNARTVGNQLLVNAPRVAPPVEATFFQDKVKRVIPGKEVTNGWAGVAPGKARTELREKFQRETKGMNPGISPARAVVQADLAAVPVGAIPAIVPPVVRSKGDGGGRPIAGETPRVREKNPIPAEAGRVSQSPTGPLVTPSGNPAVVVPPPAGGERSEKPAQPIAVQTGAEPIKPRPDLSVGDGGVVGVPVRPNKGGAIRPNGPVPPAGQVENPLGKPEQPAVVVAPPVVGRPIPLPNDVPLVAKPDRPSKEIVAQPTPPPLPVVKGDGVPAKVEIRELEVERQRVAEGEAQNAAQNAAKQQAVERQRAAEGEAQNAAKQQAVERQQAAESAAQNAAKQQAVERQQAAEIAAQNAARQQAVEHQRAAESAAQNAAKQQ
ncbi:MAG: hypothetical protein NTX04_13935, partial [Verrucomicrobia bacterium]|nr:hypothetical protein [Verrucomicrobiota bacterium]